MSIWMRHLNLSVDEEAGLTKTSDITLPLDGLPDLSLIQQPVELKHLLAALHPGAPPETLQRMQERYWAYAKGPEVEDIIAVPLKHQKIVALAEVSGPYRYNTDAAGTDQHTLPVVWYNKTIPFRRFGRNASALQSDANPLHEVQDSKVREVIRSALPYSYNRFAALKWIIGLFILWRLIMFMNRQGGF